MENEKKLTVISLSIKERLYLINLMKAIISKKGSFLELIVAKHILDKTDFSPEEIDSLNFRNTKKENNGVEYDAIEWDTEKDITKEVSLTKTEITELDTWIRALGENGESMDFIYILIWEKLNITGIEF
jgi:hypothetical protein